MPLPSAEGPTLLEHDARLWELCTWRPGVARLVDDPTTKSLEAACEMLARVHRAAATHQTPGESLAARIAPSPAVRQRVQLTRRLVDGAIVRLQQLVAQRTHGEVRRLLTHALDLAVVVLPLVGRELEPWQDRPIMLHWRLTDVRPEHLLFLGEAVTGLVDFGAAAIDAPVGDLARLLGGMPQDGSDYWRVGVAAYQRQRPLTAEELRLMPLLDVSGVCLASANWARWLTDTDVPTHDVAAAESRLRQLVDRLELLAKNQSGRIQPPF